VRPRTSVATRIQIRRNPQGFALSSRCRRPRDAQRSFQRTEVP
jgi:hypothetical protein